MPGGHKRSNFWASNLSGAASKFDKFFMYIRYLNYNLFNQIKK